MTTTAYLAFTWPGGTTRLYLAAVPPADLLAWQQHEPDATVTDPAWHELDASADPLDGVVAAIPARDVVFLPADAALPGQGELLVTDAGIRIIAGADHLRRVQFAALAGLPRDGDAVAVPVILVAVDRVLAETPTLSCYATPEETLPTVSPRRGCPRCGVGEASVSKVDGVHVRCRACDSMWDRH
jgi:hypothetical protein